jgi:hypothetical protein
LEGWRRLEGDMRDTLYRRERILTSNPSNPPTFYPIKLKPLLFVTNLMKIAGGVGGWRKVGGTL